MKKKLIVIFSALTLVLTGCGSGGGDSISIGAITSTETKVMAHVYKQLIEDQTDLSVEVKEDLATSPVVKIGRAQRLNSSHVAISYAVFCLKKKTKTYTLCDSY